MPSKSAPPPATPAQPASPRRRRGTGAITLRDIARLAGVAPITASRALNTPDAVSDEVLQRVRAAVERTGYVPNMLAGGLASRKSRLVAAVVPTIAGPVFLETVEALTTSLADAGYQLMIGQTGYDEAREEALLEAVLGRRPDAIFLAGLVRSARARRRLVASGIPVVESWDLTPTPVNMLVGFSHEKIGEAVARFVHERGYGRPALIYGSDERAGRRSQAFQHEARRLKMGGKQVPSLVVPAPTSLATGRNALAQFLHESADIDVVVCSSDELALGVMIEAHSRSLSIPGQLAVIGFGDQRYAASLEPPLTTVRIDGTGIGRAAAQRLIARIEGREVAEPILDMGFSIVERGST